MLILYQALHHRFSIILGLMSFNPVNLYFLKRYLYFKSHNQTLIIIEFSITNVIFNMIENTSCKKWMILVIVARKGPQTSSALWPSPKKGTGDHRGSYRFHRLASLWWNISLYAQFCVSYTFGRWCGVLFGELGCGPS